MDTHQIDQYLQTIEQANSWVGNVPASERLDFRKKLINLRREFKRVRYAVSEPCSTAAFGESQMGKSYLVSAMLSTPSAPFSVTDGTQTYDFISEINPSRPNSTIEATGVITRFTTHDVGDVPQGYLRVQLLSLTDILLILCEAYYNQVDYPRESILSSTDIDDALCSLPTGGMQQLLTVDDVLDLREYINRSSMLQKKCNHLLESTFFDFLVEHLGMLNEDTLTEAMTLLWNREEHITRLWYDMLSAYRQLGFHQTVFARFDAVLKCKGTLLDVARLDEMYDRDGLGDLGAQYSPKAMVKLTPSSEATEVDKSFLSALIAELCFQLPEELVASHAFLRDLDILDFPGARRPEQIQQQKLGEGKNLPTVLRRGKVSYLFNKYSAAKRISSLLFCHNNSMSAESSMGGLLDKWVNTSVGTTPREREDYVKVSALPPLFIIGTWFNKDLEYQDEPVGDYDRLKERWTRRFNTVLEKEVLKSLGDPDHWFNHWTDALRPFQNIYMLRDFKYSKAIYYGYNPQNGTSESGAPVSPDAYPSFFSDLRRTFVEHEFVREHFAQPERSWDDAATCAHDGTLRIISQLDTIAPNVAQAREEKFAADVKTTARELKNLLARYYHPENGDERLKQAKRQAGSACRELDSLLGRDSYAFGRLLDTMMVAESEFFELIHANLLGEELAVPMSDEESRIFMSAGLDSTISREENIERLCDYLGVDDEDECRDELGSIDLDKLLSHNQMVSGRADNLVDAVLDLWHDRVLLGRTVHVFEDELPSVSNIVTQLWTLFRLLDVRSQLIARVKRYLDETNDETAVGIIADYLAMVLNEFASTFGYAYYPTAERQRLMELNRRIRLNIDENLINAAQPEQGMGLLADLYRQREVLSGMSFSQADRQSLQRFPQYMHQWRWQQQLRAGFAFATDLPDYDVRANKELGDILNTIKQ